MQAPIVAWSTCAPPSARGHTRSDLIPSAIHDWVSEPTSYRGGRNLVTDTINLPAVSGRGGALSSFRLPELQAIASEMGIKGTAKMRKSDLVSAIRDGRGSSDAATRAAAPAQAAPAEAAPARPGKRDRSTNE